jgi:hypothetical protein
VQQRFEIHNTKTHTIIAVFKNFKKARLPIFSHIVFQENENSIAGIAPIFD